ncbi:hypothetical protein H2198_003295 [Neophaeococcomyces mojaviensis]|uniref:Uncharacterized protein n=1 Tax=Neophaeococcomyces mojaviensis TaxID=3383035 RepID=A0ACC3ABS5_9EURO|nr:hypothetical protein H2198_003295 [Knufia sp. JES_112]
MDSPFHVTEHAIPGQHIRGYPKGTRTCQEDVFQIAIKQYVPVGRPDPVPENAITIIGLHGIGFPKELYEPLMALLCSQLRINGICVRGIWMADSSNHGASGVLNENIQGDMIDHFDHSRDLLSMINHFRHEMPRPLIGFAHSYGCPQLVQLSLMHPRLLSTLILCEPIIFNSTAINAGHPGMLSSVRRDIWSTRAEAANQLRRGLKKQNWDDRVLELYLKYGLRPVPTAIYDPANDNTIPQDAVTLTTTKHQEVWTFCQLNLDEPDEERDKLLKPYQDPKELRRLAARPDVSATMRNLPFIKPSVLFVFGGKSPVSPPSWRDEKYHITGTGVGGSGGAKAGRVEQIVFEKEGHLLPFESGVLEKLVSVSADWIGKWYQGWLKDEQTISDYGSPQADESGLRMSREYLAAMKVQMSSPRPFKMPAKM